MRLAAYWIVRIEVTNFDAYKEYAAKTPAVVAKFGGRFLVKGGAMEQTEGSGPERHVVIEFPDIEQARACYNPPDYKAILPIALQNSTRDMVFVQGV